MKRRTFIGAGAAAIGSAAHADIPIIDTHVHLYDPSRPQGVPWPPKDSPIYKTTLPSRLRSTVNGLGVVGAIEVECSPWLEDNQWVLDVSAKDTIMVGMVGNLEPDKPEFRKQLDRFAKNPLYLGIRHGYLWDRDPGTAVGRAEFISGLKDLAAADLVLDTANPSVKLLRDMLRITDRVPDLRIVLDHMAALYPADSPTGQEEFQVVLRELHGRPKVYAKLSAVLRTQGDKKVPWQMSAHKDRLDAVYEAFGPDRVLYGSDWPNSDTSAPYAEGLRVMREYFDLKDRAAAEKYFWRNSAAVYRWKPRAASQPRA